MGYTHYFKQNKPVDDQTWQKIINDCKKIVDNLKNELPSIKLGSDDPNGVMFNSERINLNDIYSGHETFNLPKKDLNFNFCKTAQKPYDLAVCCMLLIVHHHAPDYYDISSDGTSEDWSVAIDFNARTLGYAYKFPPSLQDYDSPDIESDAQQVAQTFFPEQNKMIVSNVQEIKKSDNDEPISRRFNF